MKTKEVVTRYFDYVNSGRWDDYLTLFADDVVMDEQLLGHIVGIKEVAKGIEGLKSNPNFRNYLREMVIKGDEAMVTWNIKSPNPDGSLLNFRGMNYYKIKGGKIIYFANFHDTAPFEKS